MSSRGGATNMSTVTRAGVVSAGAATALPALARAAALPAPRAYPATAVPSSRDLHLMRRFSFGFSAALQQQVATSGGARAWFNAQLSPETVPDAFADQLYDWFPRLETSPRAAYATRAQAGARMEFSRSSARHSMLRQVYSNRQVHEVMVDFWLNHFHVFAQDNHAWPFRPGYDKTIRAHALGSFEDLLKAADTHPAMLLYLNQERSTGTNINENLGRELLELHTVGIGAGYTEAEVKDSARILTGQLVDRDSLELSYSDRDHFHGRVTVLGFTHANTVGQGRAVLDAYLSYLARHPATARRLARKLAVRFVSDDPPTALIERVARAYLVSDTDIKATLRALVDDPQFYEAATPKVRTACEDVVATMRAVGVRIGRPTTAANEEGAHAIVGLASGIGQRPWHWVTPDGFPDRSDAWASASRMLASFRVHYNLAGGFYPTKHIDFQLGADWLPKRQLRFDQLVDHLCRRLHGSGSTAALLGAACDYLDVSPGTVITPAHSVCGRKMSWLLALLLDSPAHMTR